MELTPGMKLRSGACEAQFVVVRAASGDVDLRCGGAPLLAGDAEGGEATLDPELSGGSLLGKRYADETSGLELLCTKAGQGSLTLGGAPLGLKSAKPLPSSD
jgi:hypothetical protein